MRILEAVQIKPFVIKEKTLIIIPTYNERDNIVELLTQITAMVPAAGILVVDDRSPDGTAGAVRDFRDNKAPENLFLLVRDGERGLGNAYREGLRYGLDHGYEIMITMDADISHNPLHLPSMLTALEHHDVVIGSRYIKDGGTINWRIRRILLSWLANRFARFMLNLKGSDLTSGYRAYRRGILEAIVPERVQSNGYSYLVEMLFWAQRKKAAISEVPIIFFDRSMGSSKISRREMYRGALTLFRLRFTQTDDTGN